MKNRLPWLLLFFLALSICPAAENGGIEARLTSAKVVEVLPGKIVTGSILVANRTDRDEALIEQVKLPDGWICVSPPEIPVTVPAHSELVRLIAIAVPASTIADQFEIRYAAKSLKDYGLADAVSFTASVLSVTKVELTVESAPQIVVAGEDCEVRLRLVNRGNRERVLSLQASSTPDAPSELSPQIVRLAPGESQLVNVKVTTDGNRTKRADYAITIRAFSAGTSKAQITRTVVVDVIPKITGDTDRYIRLPARLLIAGTKDSGKSGGFQAELSGAGEVDEAGKRRVEFLFRGPDMNGNSLYENRDEYRISYYDVPIDVHLGDRSYSLSPLTERYSYGRGAEVNLRQGSLGIGAFYLKSRWHDDYSETGAYFKQQVNDHWEIKGNYLQKSGRSDFLTNAVPANIYSLQTQLRFGRPLTLDIEYGISDSADGLDDGWRLEARGALCNNKVTYTLEKNHANPKFYGYYSDSDSTYGTITVPIYKKLRGTFSFNSYDRNLDVNPAKSTVANRETVYRPGLLYTFPFGTDLTLQYQNLRRKDVLPPVAYDFEENSFRLGVGHDFGKVSIQAFIGQGTVHDFTLDQDHNLLRFSCYAFYRPTTRQTYSAFATLGTSRDTGTTRESQTFGGSARWKIRDNLACEVKYAHNNFDALTGRQQDNVYSTVNYTFPNRHNVTVSGRWTKDSTSRQSETSVYFAYSVPLSIPIGKRHSTGILRGRVFNVEDSINPQLSRVVLTTARLTAVTDSHGDFVFPSLPPGTYLIRLQQNTIGMDRTTTEPLPLVVEVKNDTETRLDIGVVRASHVTAKLLIYESLAGSQITTNNLSGLDHPGRASTMTGANNMEPVGGLEMGLVEFTNGRETIREVTDRRGEVSLDHLRPGKWTLKVYENHLPANHFIETPETQFVLKPGEENQINIRILPRRRTIQLIDQGIVK